LSSLIGGDREAQNNLWILKEFVTNIQPSLAILGRIPVEQFVSLLRGYLVTVPDEIVKRDPV